jgi:precorrin-2 dehydrogenase/sirohydrochlorin ferrochelatase
VNRYLPVCLDLRDRPVVILGGGNVATAKVADFLECGARLTVISPLASPAIRDAAAEGRLALHLRPFRPGDTEGAFLVMVATDDPAANAAAFAEADGRGVLVNVCDDPPHCNVIFASRIERGPLTVSVFTHGTSPALSRRVRRELEAWLGPEYGEFAELLAELRPRVKELPGLTQPQRQRVFERLVYSELLLLFREGRGQEARRLAEDLVRAEVAALQP